jgi:gliding motility-associated-like protein
VTDANGCITTATITITQPPLLTATQSQTNVLCNGACNGTASVVASGGTPAYSYLWAPSGGNTANATGLCAGSYSCTITDSKGCTVQKTFTITQPPVLTATTTQVNILCNGGNNGSTTVTASGGTTPYTYSWNTTPSQTTTTATGLTAGSYVITVTDANGCTVAVTVTITQPVALTLTTSFTQSTCGQPNGSATVTASGGTTPYSYSWNTSPVQTTSTATGLAAGSYVITVTDANGCTATATVNVPNAGSPTASISTSVNVLCFGGNNGSATATATGGTAPYNYSWNTTPAQLTATATGLTAGTYVVTVTDANGCTSTATVTITQPTQLTAIISSSVNILCFGGNNGSATVTAGGGTPAYSYSWNTTPAQLTATATGLTAGNYVVTVTDANGCTATATVTITQPTQLVIAVAGFNTSCNNLCNGQGVCIPSGGTAPYTFSWAPVGGNNPSATGLCAGIYTVYVTDANGCAINDTAIVNQPTPFVTTTSNTTAHCNQPDGSACVNVSGSTPPYTYSWSTSPSQTTTCATGLVPGSYNVVITDFNGCTTSATVVVPNAAGVVASISGFNNASCFGSCNGDATALATGGNGPYTYSWSTTPSQSTAAASGLCAGTYTCLVTDFNGCSDTAVVTITQPQQLVITPGPAVTICIGQSTTLTATATGGTAPYSFTWNPGNLTGSSVSVSPTTTTTYTVTATDANNCTAVQQTLVVTVNPPLSVVASGATAVCIGGSASIQATASGGNGGPYTYIWTPGNLSGSSVSVTPTATTTYTITVTDNCTTTPATDTVTIIVNPLPTVTFTTNPTPAQGCAPLCVDFTNTTPNTSVCDWNFSVGTVTGNCNPQFCFTSPGTYDVTLSVVDNNGCANSLLMPALVTVWPNPVADFTMSPQPTTIMNGTISFTDLSQLANTWTWNFGDILNSGSNQQNPQFTYTDSGYYVVTLWVSTIHGCTDSISKTLRIDPDFALYVPNAFTPNGDGNNDNFIPKGVGIDENKFKMWIFDRWGNMIWFTDSWGKSWDGRANDGNDVAQEDVYVWMIEVYDYLGKKHKYVGHVSLIK